MLTFAAIVIAFGLIPSVIIVVVLDIKAAGSASD
jgi:hypothetical protein